MSEPRTAGGAQDAMQIAPPRLIEKKIRVTQGQIDRFNHYRSKHEGKREADAWRDVVNAGLNVLVPAPAATNGGQ
ncbi:hypothetical protein [Fontivita pretiosa]|uniref:hypothetical protein n=1 Tax=Fontivita pretiosa TaxID=2989684 RepID=UPI003D16496F